MNDTTPSQKKSKKATQLQETARQLFYKYGMRRVTIDEICKTSGVSKMTFYKYFSNKLDIAKSILEEMFEDGLHHFHHVRHQEITFAEKLEKMLQFKMERLDHMSEEFFEEIRESIPELKNYMMQVQQESMKLTLEFLVEEQSKGEIRQDVSPQFILYLMNQLFQMALDPELISLFPEPQDRIRELNWWFVYGLMPQTSTHT